MPGLCALAGPPRGRDAFDGNAALLFVPLWLAVPASICMYLGIKQAGYSVNQEAPMLLLVFAVRATAALLAWWMLR